MKLKEFGPARALLAPLRSATDIIHMMKHRSLRETDGGDAINVLMFVCGVIVVYVCDEVCIVNL